MSTLDEELLALEQVIRWLKEHSLEFLIPDHYVKYLANNIQRQREVLNTLTSKR